MRIFRSDGTENNPAARLYARQARRQRQIEDHGAACKDPRNRWYSVGRVVQTMVVQSQVSAVKTSRMVRNTVHDHGDHKMGTRTTSAGQHAIIVEMDTSCWSGRPLHPVSSLFKSVKLSSRANFTCARPWNGGQARGIRSVVSLYHPCRTTDRVD